MIGKAVQKLLLENRENFIISSENVAHVMDEHPLSHALLVVTQVGYSQIPVLNKDNQLVGSLSLAAIVKSMFDVSEISPDRLNNLLVKDVMKTDIPTVHEDFTIEEVLHLLVNTTFLSVVNEKQEFQGIIPRKAVLKATNHLAHQLEVEYEVIEKALEPLRKENVG